MARKPGSINPDSTAGNARLGVGRGSNAGRSQPSSANKVAKIPKNFGAPFDPRAKAQALRGTILRQGGVTINAKTRNVVSPKRGYSVGIAPKTAVRIGTSRATPGRVVGGLDKVANKYNPKNMGAWYDKGQIHIDPVKIVKSYGKAQRLGRQFNQQSIYSFTTGKSLAVLKRGR
jgi:hypothetical protein